MKRIKIYLLYTLVCMPVLILSQNENYAQGTNALNSNTNGSYNIALGYNALYSNTSGSYNYSIGMNALRSNTTGEDNAVLGRGALYGNTTGSYNIGIGYSAGRYIAGGSTENMTSVNSIFIGRGTKALGNSQTNQIVIGYNAIGNGSNSITIGNDEIAKTILKGKIGIGTIQIPDNFKLAVAGKIIVEEVVVKLQNNWPDYVFEPDYDLMPLHKVEQFVQSNKHLPGIPPASEVKNDGLSMGEMQNKLLQKIEELTLYMIEQGKTISQQNARIKELEERLK
ncbi:MAG: hypothetical protein VB102_02240 [Paludibacter sp.]|nr:hypothetical protein [Paludibacter sp.]